jgi:aryl-alcohol dehydrogenase-like predicted oxidoreductase
MDYRKLGRTGLKVSEMCLGTMTFEWTSSREDSLAVLDRFWEVGGNFIDTADVYSRWADGNPGGVAETIIGANTVQQLDESLGALGLRLDDAEMARLDEVTHMTRNLGMENS